MTMDMKTGGVLIGSIAAIAALSALTGSGKRSRSNVEEEDYSPDTVPPPGEDQDPMLTLAAVLRDAEGMKSSKARDMVRMVADKAKILSDYRQLAISKAASDFLTDNDPIARTSKEEHQQLADRLYKLAVKNDPDAIEALAHINRGSFPRAGEMLYETYLMLNKYADNVEDPASNYKEIADDLRYQSYFDAARRETDDPFVRAARSFDSAFFRNRYDSFGGLSPWIRNEHQNRYGGKIWGTTTSFEAQKTER